MKRKIISLMLILSIISSFMPTFSITTSAAIEYIDGIYTYTVVDDKASIIKCDTSASGEIGIPSILGGYPIISIGKSAFSGCSSLTGITIQNGVVDIGAAAFANCTGLTSITIPDGVMSIGDSAFYRCSKLEKVTIPDGVTSIGDSMFEDCRGLESVTIPDSVSSIGAFAFAGCYGLTSITIPEGVNEIDEHAFYGCGYLESVTLPKTLLRIGGNAFESTGRIKDVYYAGSEEEWGKISIEYGNKYLTKATIHYNSIITPYTVSEVIVNDKSYVVKTTVHNVNDTCCVIVVGYNGNRFVSMERKEYSGQDETFTLTGDMDEIRVMLWRSFESLKPIAVTEIISCEELTVE